MPNQCNDQHGRGNGTAFCDYDPNDNGTQAGLNPALILLGDRPCRRSSPRSTAPGLEEGHTAIVSVWDENDYAVQPIINKVLAIVDTNYGVHGCRAASSTPTSPCSRRSRRASGLPVPEPCLRRDHQYNVGPLRSTVKNQRIQSGKHIIHGTGHTRPVPVCFYLPKRTYPLKKKMNVWWRDSTQRPLLIARRLRSAASAHCGSRILGGAALLAPRQERFS